MARRGCPVSQHAQDSKAEEGLPVGMLGSPGEGDAQAMTARLDEGGGLDACACWHVRLSWGGRRAKAMTARLDEGGGLDACAAQCRPRWRDTVLVEAASGGWKQFRVAAPRT